MVFRFISGLPPGAFFGAAAIAAERIATEARRAESVAIVLGGMTVANMVGVPFALIGSAALCLLYKKYPVGNK